MSVALNVASVESGSRRKIVVVYNVTHSGSYIQEASSPNEVVDLTAATDTGYKGYRVPSRAPETLEYIGAPGGTPFEAHIGATAALCYLKGFKALNTELDAGAYNAAVTGDTTPLLRATWSKGRY